MTMTPSLWTSPVHNNPRARVAAPNAQPRDMLVVALDPPSAGLGPLLAGERWRGTEFVQFAGGETGWAGHVERRRFDMLVLIAHAGARSAEVDAIGAYCVARAIKIAVILVAPRGLLSPGAEAYLANLREWAHTIAIVDDPDMVTGLLHGLGG